MNRVIGDGMSNDLANAGCRASNGIFYRVVGNGEPLLLLHGLMVSGAMFDPLVELLHDRYRMLIPDLRGHGNSSQLSGPYDVPALAADLDAVISEAGFERLAVMGYSHGGAVAQQFAHVRPAAVSKLMLVCTYACNVATVKERIEAILLVNLLRVFSPKTLARLIVQSAKSRGKGATALSREQAECLYSQMSANRAPAMRGAFKGLLTFDSRPWLDQIKAPTLVVGGTDDIATPQHHFDMLVRGIPGASGCLVDRADHTLIWTQTRELADIMSAHWNEAREL